MSESDTTNSRRLFFVAGGLIFVGGAATTALIMRRRLQIPLSRIPLKSLVSRDAYADSLGATAAAHHPTIMVARAFLLGTMLSLTSTSLLFYATRKGLGIDSMGDLRQYMSGVSTRIGAASEHLIPDGLREKAAMVPETREEIDAVDQLWAEVVAWWDGTSDA